jgi:hypothetical protein
MVKSRKDHKVEVVSFSYVSQSVSKRQTHLSETRLSLSNKGMD